MTHDHHAHDCVPGEHGEPADLHARVAELLDDRPYLLLYLADIGEHIGGGVHASHLGVLAHRVSTLQALNMTSNVLQSLVAEIGREDYEAHVAAEVETFREQLAGPAAAQLVDELPVDRGPERLPFIGGLRAGTYEDEPTYGMTLNGADGEVEYVCRTYARQTTTDEAVVTRYAYAWVAPYRSLDNLDEHERDQLDGYLARCGRERVEPIGAGT